MKYLVVTFVALAAIGACTARPSRGGDASAPAVDAIMLADREFNAAVAARDVQRFRSFLAEGAVFNGGTPGEVRGQDAVAADWAPYFLVDGPRLTWSPTHGELLGDGALGYTVGSWERRGASSEGQAVRRGQYLTVWRKQADGAWKIVYDTGSAVE